MSCSIDQKNSASFHRTIANSLTALTLALSLWQLMAPRPAQAGIIDFIFGAGKFGRKASPVADCRSLWQRLRENTAFMNDETWKTRVVPERDPHFLNDREYLEEMKLLKDTLGGVDTRFIKELDTRVFYTATARALPDGTIPMVDPEAKALVIYFHGSGTAKASGANFAGKMNSLAKMGYSALSFDLPFHKDGSRNPALARTEAFSDYLDKLINKVRQPGQPVYLVGHSFGPDVMAEYITRHPHGVDGVVMLSPGSFDKPTKKWFEDQTVYMTRIFGDVEPNNFGGRWASMVTNERTWNNLKAKGRQDPTEVNPKLKVHVISGDREEYIPGPLDAEGYPNSEPRSYDVEQVFKTYFKNAEVTIEPGVGHYIFAHTDAEGQDVVLRSILKVNGDKLANEKALKAETSKRMESKTPIDLLAAHYWQQPFFRSWLDSQAKAAGAGNGQQWIARMLSEGDKKGASKLMANFGIVEKQRLEVINANIRTTEQWAPEFFAEHKEQIEKLGTKGYDPASIYSKYLTFLKTQPDVVVREYSVATNAVYKIPEKPAPQGQRPDIAKRGPASLPEGSGFWPQLRGMITDWCATPDSWAGKTLRFFGSCR